MKIAHSDAPGDFAIGSSPPLWRPQIAIERIPSSNSEFTLLYIKDSLFLKQFWLYDYPFFPSYFFKS